jgi:hypothetical protein
MAINQSKEDGRQIAALFLSSHALHQLENGKRIGEVLSCLKPSALVEDIKLLLTKPDPAQAHALIAAATAARWGGASDWPEWADIFKRLYDMPANIQAAGTAFATRHRNRICKLAEALHTRGTMREQEILRLLGVQAGDRSTFDLFRNSQPSGRARSPFQRTRRIRTNAASATA